MTHTQTRQACPAAYTSPAGSSTLSSCKVLKPYAYTKYHYIIIIIIIVFIFIIMLWLWLWLIIMIMIWSCYDFR